MPAYDVELLIRRREGILDPQGQTLEKSMKRIGFKGVSGVRVDKEIRFRLEAHDQGAAAMQAQELGRRLLANPVLEDAVIGKITLAP